MVTFFFTLSGFVITISMANKKENSIQKYYIARLCRISPIYFITLAITVFLTYGNGNNNFISLMLSSLYLQSWFPPYPLSLNSPGWSVSVEMFFYISFPLVFLLIKSSKIKPEHLIIIAILFYLFSQCMLSNLLRVNSPVKFPSPLHDLLYYFPLSHYCSFILGVAAGYFFSNRPSTNKVFFNALSALSFFILILALMNPRDISDFIGYPIVTGASFYSMFFAILILSIAYSENTLTKLISRPTFILLGEASYSLYLLQKPVRLLYMQHISPYLKLSSAMNFYVFVFLLIMASILSFKLIEMPCKRILSNILLTFTKKHQTTELEPINN